jgi:hypothetical protein
VGAESGAGTPSTSGRRVSSKVEDRCRDRPDD